MSCSCARDSNCCRPRNDLVDYGEIWRDGRQAYANGQPETDNPYTAFTLQHEAWGDGWKLGGEQHKLPGRGFA